MTERIALIFKVGSRPTVEKCLTKHTYQAASEIQSRPWTARATVDIKSALATEPRYMSVGDGEYKNRSPDYAGTDKLAGCSPLPLSSSPGTQSGRWATITRKRFSKMLISKDPRPASYPLSDFPKDTFLLSPPSLAPRSYHLAIPPSPTASQNLPSTTWTFVAGFYNRQSGLLASRHRYVIFSVSDCGFRYFYTLQRTERLKRNIIAIRLARQESRWLYQQRQRVRAVSDNEKEEQHRQSEDDNSVGQRRRRRTSSTRS